jgi:hypothetical protein
MAFTVLAIYLRLAKFSLSLLDAMRGSAYGIYLTTFSSSGGNTPSTTIPSQPS